MCLSIWQKPVFNLHLPGLDLNNVLSEILLGILSAFSQFSVFQGRGVGSPRVWAGAGERLEERRPRLKETRARGQVCGHAV